jgi:hypothetical protein
MSSSGALLRDPPPHAPSAGQRRPRKDGSGGKEGFECDRYGTASIHAERQFVSPKDKSYRTPAANSNAWCRLSFHLSQQAQL